jgi:orotate phosphoribosyltransferase
MSVTGWRSLASEEPNPLSKLTDEVLELVRSRGYDHRDAPFRLSSGELSNDYVDGKRAIANGAALRLVAEAIVEVAADEGVDFEAVGGLTMGGDPLAHAVAMVTGKAWFSVRKKTKEHGTQRLIEGYALELNPGTRVLVVDDVVTTGGSIEQALDAVDAVDAEVVLAVTLVDRGEQAAERMRRRGVRYRPLATYKELGIPPVGSGREHAPTSG